MDWNEALEMLDEGYIIKLPDKPSGIRVEMGAYVEVWEDGRESLLDSDIAPLFKKSNEWEIAEWTL